MAHGLLLDQEQPRDVAGGQTTDGLQCERNPVLQRQVRMAAGEQQPHRSSPYPPPASNVGVTRSLIAAISPSAFDSVPRRRSTSSARRRACGRQSGSRVVRERRHAARSATPFRSRPARSLRRGPSHPWCGRLATIEPLDPHPASNGEREGEAHVPALLVAERPHRSKARSRRRGPSRDRKRSRPPVASSRTQAHRTWRPAPDLGKWPCVTSGSHANTPVIASAAGRPITHHVVAGVVCACHHCATSRAPSRSACVGGRRVVSVSANQHQVLHKVPSFESGIQRADRPQ